MNVVQTYYSYANDENPIKDTAGFLSADMNWKSMALSCLLLKKHYRKVTLYCNRKVRHLIIDQFKIPYDVVVEIPEFMKIYEGCNLWALPKIYTYSLQTEPFIHVDCDWFMFEKLSASIVKSDVIGQNIEYDDQFYNRRTLEKLILMSVIFILGLWMNTTRSLYFALLRPGYWVEMILTSYRIM